MNNLWLVVALALLPGLGNFAGAMVAEFIRTTPRLLNFALHTASGIVIGVVAIELMPEALNNLAGWWIALSFAAGGAVYIGMETLLEKKQSAKSGGGSTGMWMIYVAVAVDLSGDGLMIGSGSAVGISLAIVLAAGQVLADFPEGYSVVANLRENGVARKRRIAVSLSFPLYCLGAALLAWFLLRSAPDAAKYVALSFVAGLLSVAAVEDMLEEAHEAANDNRSSALAFVGGFVLFTLVSSGLETVLSEGGASGGQGGSGSQETGEASNAT
ncbi:ZIP family metal transporter [Tranquillimonas alkanivorans]|uniref:Zinc transporter, ZIP family n=1 Tax=Tranquillimonas alkanivorans TaxID=441119 RepID=A0A1I5TNN9_9RHOB|nr:peptidoglycan-binding protein [Tranquillimonas alkanivorans]SFP84653.1 zinc transporter, ZIP family [Tranquillimonas alkanivorans]